MDGIDAFILTTQPLGFAPISFTVGGAPTAVKQLDVDAIDGTSWYWRYQSNQVFKADLAPPGSGIIISIIYEAQFSNSVTTIVPASITELADINVQVDPPSSPYDYVPDGGSGIYSTTYDVRGVETQDQAEAIAAGLQRRASVTPRAFSFKTDIPGWSIGQTLTFQHVGFDLIGEEFVVVSKSGKPSAVSRGRGSFMEYTLEAVILEDVPEQDPADPNPPARVITSAYPITGTQPYERLREATRVQPPPVRYKEWQIVLGSGGDLVAASPLGNRMFVFEDQTFLEVYILPDPSFPPVDQDLEVDAFLDGTSIFNAPFTVPAGTTTPIATTFRGAPTELRGRRGQVVTFSAEYVNIGGAPGAAQNLTLQWRSKVI